MALSFRCHFSSNPPTFAYHHKHQGSGFRLGFALVLHSFWACFSVAHLRVSPLLISRYIVAFTFAQRVRFFRLNGLHHSTTTSPNRARIAQPHTYGYKQAMTGAWLVRKVVLTSPPRTMAFSVFVGNCYGFALCTLPRHGGGLNRPPNIWSWSPILSSYCLRHSDIYGG